MALYPSWRKLRQRMPSLWWMVSGLDHGQYAQTGQQGNLQPKVMVMIIIIICYILFWILLGMLLISWKIFSETVFELMLKLTLSKKKTIKIITKYVWIVKLQSQDYQHLFGCHKRAIVLVPPNIANPLHLLSACWKEPIDISEIIDPDW